MLTPFFGAQWTIDHVAAGDVRAAGEVSAAGEERAASEKALPRGDAGYEAGRQRSWAAEGNPAAKMSAAHLPESGHLTAREVPAKQLQ